MRPPESTLNLVPCAVSTRISRPALPGSANSSTRSPSSSSNDLPGRISPPSFGRNRPRASRSCSPALAALPPGARDISDAIVVVAASIPWCVCGVSRAWDPTRVWVDSEGALMRFWADSAAAEVAVVSVASSAREMAWSRRDMPPMLPEAGAAGAAKEGAGGAWGGLSGAEGAAASGHRGRARGGPATRSQRPGTATAVPTIRGG